MQKISRNVLLFVNVVAVLLAIVILAFTLAVMYGASPLAQLEGVPLQVYYTVIAFNLVVFCIGILGIISGCLHSKPATIIFIGLNLLTVIVQIIVMIMLLLYANGVSTGETVDKALRDTQHAFQLALVDAAVDDPTGWQLTQTSFGCCGVDFNATYLYAEHSKTDLEFVEVLQPSDKCAEGRAKILELHGLYPTYSAEAEKAALASTELGGVYFCKLVISKFARDNTMYIGIIVGFLVLVQIVTIVAAFILLCRTTVDQGGFLPPKEQTAGQLAFNSGGGGAPQANTVDQGNTYV